MTIPIIPGPFSFLGSAGEALGNIGTLKEQRRQTGVAEANQAAQLDLQRRQVAIQEAAQSLQEALSKGKIEDIEARSNYLEWLQKGGNQPTPLAIPSLIGGTGGIAGFTQGPTPPPPPQFTPEVLAAHGITTPAEFAATQAEAQAKVPKAELEGTQARAALPGAAQAIQTAQISPQVAQLEPVADTFVQALFTQLKRMPTGQEAYEVAIQDPRFGEIAKTLGPAFFDAAVERQRQVLEKESTARTAAAARAQSTDVRLLTNEQNVVQREAVRISGELKAVEAEITGRDGLLLKSQYRRYQDDLAAGKKPTPTAEAAAQQYEALLDRQARLRSEQRINNDQLRQLGLPEGVAGEEPPPTPRPSPAPKPTPTDQARTWLSEELKKIEGDPDEATIQRLLNEARRRFPGAQIGVRGP